MSTRLLSFNDIRFYHCPMLSLTVLVSLTVTCVSAGCVLVPSVVTENTYLRHHLLGSTNTPGWYDCAAFCQSLYGCLSFGFEPGNKTCHLHTEESSTAQGDLVPQSPWIHGDLSQLPKNLWGPCSDHSCPAGQRCIVNRRTKRPFCRQTDILPDGHCPVPPELTNAIISSGGQETGSSRTYTCLDGYLDAASFVTSGVSTCLPDNTWSSVNLTCSATYVQREQMKDSDPEYSPIGPISDFTGGSSSLLFSVKGCIGARIVLCSGSFEDEDHCYGVAIGGNVNKRALIRWPAFGEIRAIIYEDGMLSCTEFRPFWISWLNGVLAVGKGNVAGSQELLRWKPTTFIDINHVGHKTRAENGSVWRFIKQN